MILDTKIPDYSSLCNENELGLFDSSLKSTVLKELDRIEKRKDPLTKILGHLNSLVDIRVFKFMTECLVKAHRNGLIDLVAENNKLLPKMHKKTLLNGLLDLPTQFKPEEEIELHIEFMNWVTQGVVNCLCYRLEMVSFEEIECCAKQFVSLSNEMPVDKRDRFEEIILLVFYRHDFPERGHIFRRVYVDYLTKESNINSSNLNENSERKEKAVTLKEHLRSLSEFDCMKWLGTKTTKRKPGFDRPTLNVKLDEVALGTYHTHDCLSILYTDSLKKHALRWIFLITYELSTYESETYTSVHALKKAFELANMQEEHYQMEVVTSIFYDRHVSEEQRETLVNAFSEWFSEAQKEQFSLTYSYMPVFQPDEFCNNAFK